VGHAQIQVRSWLGFWKKKSQLPFVLMATWVWGVEIHPWNKNITKFCGSRPTNFGILGILSGLQTLQSSNQRWRKNPHNHEEPHLQTLEGSFCSKILLTS